MRPVIPFAVQRRFFRVLWVLSHPRTASAYRRHWRKRPKVGDQVLAHGEIRIVIEVRDGGDGLVLDGGEGCSWMNCCDPA